MKLKKYKISDIQEYPGNYNQHPEYCDIIIKRFEDYAGIKAEKI